MRCWRRLGKKRSRGVWVITGSELVGLIPFEALRQAGVFYRRRGHESPRAFRSLIFWRRPSSPWG